MPVWGCFARDGLVGQADMQRVLIREVAALHFLALEAFGLTDLLHVDAYRSTIQVLVHHQPVGQFNRIYGRTVGQMNVKGVGGWIV